MISRQIIQKVKILIGCFGFVLLVALSLGNITAANATEADVPVDACINYDTGSDSTTDAEREAIAENEEAQGPTSVAATTDEIGIGVGLPGTTVENPGTYTFPQYVHGLYEFAIKVAVALCTIMIIYAGYKYLTSKGDTGAINEAKDILFSTLMGAALLILVVLVGNISGFNTAGWF
jgi:hypothetical protein